ncbi:MAG: hypothetical protein J5565_04460 [Muribaculaceae bacterium]|nr:hypothetical protein [Muribaculaceae bacterium]
MILKLIELVVLLTIIALATLYFSKKEKKEEETLGHEPSSSDLQDFIAQHGEPQDLIVVNPLANNELEGTILVYDDHLLVAGQEVQRDCIEDITFNNAAIPYINSQYQLVITTNNEVQPVVRMAIGGDAKWAGDVVAQLSEALEKK